MEYPRPQFVRKQWIDLNGMYDFMFDENNEGMKNKWYQLFPKQCLQIKVPFVYQSKESLIDTKRVVEHVWYHKEIEISKSEVNNKKVILNFGAVDYESTIFLNGHQVGYHLGGHTPFKIDLTNYYVDGINDLTIKVFDPLEDEQILRGKQFWEEKPKSIWYTQSTGIWQSVWLEYIFYQEILDYTVNANVDLGIVNFDFFLSDECINKKMQVKIQRHGKVLFESEQLIIANVEKMVFDYQKNKIFAGNLHNEGLLWSPSNPVLFDIDIKIFENELIYDEVNSYFGIRKVHIANGEVYLNNKPFYQRLVLDQGYWPDSLMTPIDDNAIKFDIEIAKKIGFNGCRKHQKLEDPKFLYWADKLGYIIWGEMASGISYSTKYANNALREWGEVIKRDYNHPSIIAWVPLNESWGVSEIEYSSLQQNHALSLFHYIKSVDNSRLVVNNDGWELTKSDICAIHNYNHGTLEEPLKIQEFNNTLNSLEFILKAKPAGRNIYVTGFNHQNEPIMLTEFGGIAFQKSGQIGWGYTSVNSEELFASELKRVVSTVINSPIISGFCYTQLYDVENEINGLLTYERELKMDANKLFEIFQEFHSNISK